MTSSLEIEVKLTGDSKALAKAWRSDVLQGDPASEEVSKSLENVYFDTADLRLRKLGYAFRIRKDGARLVQTLKNKDVGGKGIARRREWSSIVESLEPDIARVDDDIVREEIGDLTPGDLVPVFTTKVERRQRLVKRADETGQISVVEVAFDQGEIVGGGRSERIGEIEFELQRGRPAAIHDLMTDVLAAARLRIETRSKSARGYALATGKPPAWQKAGPVTLAADMTPKAAFGLIAGNCMDHWLANEPAAWDGSDPEGVHQMRVGLRRLRSALSIFEETLAPEDRGWMAEETKWLLSQTGPARDWDVALGELLPPVVAGNSGEANMAALVEASGLMRVKSHKHLREAIASPRYAAFINNLGGWLEPSGGDGDDGEAPTPGSLDSFAASLLQRRYRKIRKIGRNFEEMTPTARHQLRIALKKLRYAIDFFQSLYGKRRVKTYLKKLKSLQDLLGVMNDAAVSQRRFRDLLTEQQDAERASDLALAAGVVIGWYAHANQANERQLREMWKSFAGLKSFWSEAPKKR